MQGKKTSAWLISNVEAEHVEKYHKFCIRVKQLVLKFVCMIIYCMIYVYIPFYVQKTVMISARTDHEARSGWLRIILNFVCREIRYKILSSCPPPPSPLPRPNPLNFASAALSRK